MIKSTIFASAKNWPLRAFVQKLAPTVGGRQRGISLIEGILYLVLALSVVIGGVVLFQNAQLSNQVTETSRGVVAIASETRALHQNAREFGATGTDLTAPLKDAGAVPSNFETATGLRNPFGGSVTVTAEEQQFTIALDNVPSDACVRLTQLDERGQGTLGIGIASVEINGAASRTGPISLTDAATDCDDADPAAIIVTYDR